MSTHKSKGDHGSVAQMLSDKGVHSISILESVEQRQQTFGLVVHREHRLVHPERGRFGSSQPTLQLEQSCLEEVLASSLSTDWP
jgi:hypothetical protein